MINFVICVVGYSTKCVCVWVGGCLCAYRRKACLFLTVGTGRYPYGTSTGAKAYAMHGEDYIFPPYVARGTSDRN